MTVEVKDKIFICSGAGDDGRAQIHKMLLENRPEEIVALTVKQADAVKASKAYIYIPKAYTEAIDAVRPFADAAGVEIRTGADSPVCRDNTALISAFNGKLIRPYFIEDEETYAGYDGIAKTIVPVEDILPDSDEKKYLYVFGAVEKEGFIQAPYGTSLAGVIELAGGVKEGSEIKAVLAGGSLGSYFPADKLDAVRITKGAAYSTGAVEVLDQAYCAVDKTKQELLTDKADSCGKCPLCREGSWQFYTIFNDISNGKAKPTDVALLKDMAETIGLGAFCQFGRNMAEMVRSALEVMGGEIETHIRRKKCEANVCKRFMTMAILPDKCTGCGDCMDVCEEDAIEGKTGYIHMIDDDMCEKCGKCIEACEEDAVIIVGNVRPKLPKRLTRVGRFR